jgi:hypothetical protein
MTSTEGFPDFRDTCPVECINLNTVVNRHFDDQRSADKAKTRVCTHGPRPVVRTPQVGKSPEFGKPFSFAFALETSPSPPYITTESYAKILTSNGSLEPLGFVPRGRTSAFPQSVSV